MNNRLLCTVLLCLPVFSSSAETKVFESTCANSTVAHWQIVDGLHGPAFSGTFPKAIIEWLLANPKQ